MKTSKIHLCCLIVFHFFVSEYLIASSLYPVEKYQLSTSFQDWGDTLFDIEYRTRIDSLVKCLDLPPGTAWDVEWLGYHNRTDLRYGDILHVWVPPDSTHHSWFLAVDTVPRSSSNAFLKAITWPDAPEFILRSPSWKADTLPGFKRDKFTYKLTLAPSMQTVPALVAHPEDVNARVSMDRATVLEGPAGYRTTTFSVLAEDDTTMRKYKVVLSAMPPGWVQSFKAEPVFTEFSSAINNFIEISHPNGHPINLGEYMVIRLGKWVNGLQEALADTSYEHRYSKYIPGYDYKAASRKEWKNNPGIIAKDAVTNPVIYSDDSFVIGGIDSNYNESGTTLFNDCDIIFSSTRENLQNIKKKTIFWNGEEKYEYILPFGVPFFNPADGLYLFKILNDSVLNGIKGINDPKDFQLIDVFGDINSAIWSPGRDTLTSGFSIRRKPEYWKGDTLPGLLGSWAVNDDSSEWICREMQDYIDSGYNKHEARIIMVEGIGFHEFDPVTTHMSTITSCYYEVSMGYHSPQEIHGIVTGTTMKEFIQQLHKKDTGQHFKIIGSNGKVKQIKDTLHNMDTLIVSSANSLNKTKYILEVTKEGLNSDATLTAKEGSGYIINIEGEEGTISGFPVGTTIKEVLDNLIIPEGAILHVINQKDELIPLQRKNHTNDYAHTRATGRRYFEVRAEDFVTRILYRLQPDINQNEAYLFSDVYWVDQKSQLVSCIPEGTSIQTLLTNLEPNVGASHILTNKKGIYWEQGKVHYDDLIVVTSPSGNVVNYYNLNFIRDDGLSNTWVVSNFAHVNPISKTINNNGTGLKIEHFSCIFETPAGSQFTFFDINGMEKESGPLETGDDLIVISADKKDSVRYKFQNWSPFPSMIRSTERTGFGIYYKEKEIWPPEISIRRFLNSIHTAPWASLEVIDADSNVVTNRKVAPGYRLVVKMIPCPQITEVYDLKVPEETFVNDRQEYQIKTYPNPLHTSLTVDKLTGNEKITLLNFLGIPLQTWDVNNRTQIRINLKHYPPGPYFLIINNDNKDFRSLKIIRSK